MSQPTAGTATTSTVTVATGGGMTITVTSDGAITVTPPPVTPPSGTSTTVFFDDFTGTELNSAYWNAINTTTGPQNPEAFGSGDQEQYLASMVALDGDSNLVFTVGPEGTLGAQPGYWPSGRVDSFHAPGQFYDGVFATHGSAPKVAVLPGQSCEFSVKITPLAGLWTAFWFESPGAVGGAYPTDYYEYDGVEAGNYDGNPALTGSTAWGPGATAQQNLTARVNAAARTLFNLGDGKYHTCRIDYGGTAVSTYIDGVLQYSITQAQVNAAYGPQAGLNAQFGGQEWPYSQPEGLAIVMNCAVNQSVTGTTPAAASLPHEVMAVDWVRVYSPAGPYVA